MNESRVKSFLRSPIAWPLAGLLLLIVVNLIRDPGFLSVSVFEGRLLACRSTS